MEALVKNRKGSCFKNRERGITGKKGCPGDVPYRNTSFDSKETLDDVQSDNRVAVLTRTQSELSSCRVASCFATADSSHEWLFFRKRWY